MHSQEPVISWVCVKGLYHRAEDGIEVSGTEYRIQNTMRGDGQFLRGRVCFEVGNDLL